MSQYISSRPLDYLVPYFSSSMYRLTFYMKLGGLDTHQAVNVNGIVDCQPAELLLFLNIKSARLCSRPAAAETAMLR